MEPTYALHNGLKRFSGGEELRAYSYMGCHWDSREDRDGFVFRLWAPNAAQVSVVGDWNGWDIHAQPMEPVELGIWETFCPHAREGQAYKYYILGADGVARYKTDPFAFALCAPPENSGRIACIEGYEWQDEAYRRQQGKRKLLDSSMNIYQLHPASWKRHPDGTCLHYGELGDELIPYLKDMGYTHIELMSAMEPSRLSGKLTLGFYAPDQRYGTAKELMAFVDRCHREGIGVLFEWLPYGFPKEEQGLYDFDGGCCYESADPLMNEFPDGKGRVFDFSRGEVQSFLMSNGVFWMDMFHGDGIRMGGVTSMLYLDYDRRDYRPNAYGGKENLDAIAFLRKVNRAIFSTRRNAITIAQEHTAFPLVSRPDYDGGLGFLYKWNMGWLRDMIEYLRLDPLWRKGSHSRLTTAMEYAYAENFVLTLPHSLSRREGPLISLLPGEYDDKFADLRAFYGFMMAFPGKKLSFMGNEFAQFDPWEPDAPLQWDLLSYERHAQFRAYVRALNHLYLKDSCLWNNDTEDGGFAWISMDDRDNSVLAFRRMDRRSREILVICNFCPVVRENYRLGLPRLGEYEPVLTGDAAEFGGTGMDLPVVTAEKVPYHNLPYSGSFTLPPLSTTYYKRIVTPRKES